MKWGEFFNTIFNTLGNAINSTSIPQLIERIWRIFYKNEEKPCGGCDPTDPSDPCNQLMDLTTSSTSLALAWMIGYGVDSLPRTDNPECNSWLGRLPPARDFIIDIFKMGDFYLHTFLFLYMKSDEEGCITTSSVNWRIIISLLLAVLSNSTVRDDLSPPPQDSNKRSLPRKIIDGGCEAARALAQGRSFIASCENIYDSALDTNFANSTTGNLIRWVGAGALAVFNGGLGFSYSPHKKTEDIFFEKGYPKLQSALYTFNNFAPLAIFTTQNIYSITESKSHYQQVIFGIGLGSLLPASIFQAYRKHKTRLSANNQNDFPEMTEAKNENPEADLHRPLLAASKRQADPTILNLGNISGTENKQIENLLNP